MTYLLLFAKILLWLGWRLRRDISKFFRPNLTLYFSGYFRVFGQIEANVGLTLPDFITFVCIPSARLVNQPMFHTEVD